MRSFFSRLLIANWLFLVILVGTVSLTLYIDTIIHPNFRVVLFFFTMLFALYVSFFISYRIAHSVTSQLKSLQDQTRAINAEEFGSAKVMTGIKELADLSESIDAMYARIRRQFMDLNLEKDKFNLLLESLKEGVFAIDTEGKLLFQNKSVPKGLIMENSGMRKIDSVVVHRGLLRFLQSHILQGNEGKIQIDYKKKYYSVRLYTFKPRDSIMMFIGIILDKTEDRERQVIREQFVQSASHELKTPITSIKGYAETLDHKLKFPDSSNEKRFLSAILRNTERMIRIVEDMLTLSKIESSYVNFHPEEFDLNDLVDRMEFTLEGVLNPKEQKLITRIAPNFKVFADNILLEHLLLNLIQNASLYSGSGKEIELSAEAFPDKIQISVKDSGIGIPESELERIFERFYRVDSDRSRDQGGTGLGLAIVKHITNLHSGWVRVESELGIGSKFIVNLPIDNKGN